jgi:hypothetical protein
MASNTPLFDDDLEGLLSPYRLFKGVVMKDELKGLLQDMTRNGEDKAGVVMNLEKSNQGGSHWVAIYLDVGPHGHREICYYDSFGRKPPHDTFINLTQFISSRSFPIPIRHNQEKH